MQLYESQETKNIDLTYTYVTSSIETFKTVISFIKQYSEITKTYLDKVKSLFDKIQYKVSSSPKQSTFSSLTLFTDMLKVITQQITSLQEIINLDQHLNAYGSQLDNIVDKSKKLVDSFRESKEKLNEKYKRADKAKNKFYQEAYYIEESLLKEKTHKRKLMRCSTDISTNTNTTRLALFAQVGSSSNNKYQRLEEVSNTSTLSLTDWDIINNNDYSGNSNSSKCKDTFVKMKKSYEMYLQSISEFNTSSQEFNDSSLSYTNAMIKLKQNCDQAILEGINCLFMFMENNCKCVSKEIEVFFHQYSKGIKKVIEQSIRQELITNKGVFKLREEQYKLKFLDETTKRNSHNKHLTDKDLKDVIRIMKGVITFNVHKPSNILYDNDKSIYDLNRLMSMLLYKDYHFYPLSTQDKTFLYVLLTDIHFRYMFLTTITNKISNKAYQLVSREQFVLFANIIVFILNESFKDENYFFIQKVLVLAKNVYVVVSDKNENVNVNVLHRIKSHLLFGDIDFWMRVFEQFVYNSIEGCCAMKGEDKDNVGKVIVEEVKMLFEIMKCLNVKDDVMEKVFFRSIIKYNVELNALEELYGIVVQRKKKKTVTKIMLRGCK